MQHTHKLHHYCMQLLKGVHPIHVLHVDHLQHVSLFPFGYFSLWTLEIKGLYRAFHNVLRDYKHLQKENQRTYLNGIVHSHRKTEKVFFFSFLTTRDVRCVHHRWLDTIFKFSPHTHQHVDAGVARTWISYWCVLCHPWCTYRTSLVVKKKLFQFLTC